MTVRTVDSGSINYTSWETASLPPGNVFYRDQSGGNTVRVQKTRVPAYTIFRNGKAIRFRARTTRNSPAPRRRSQGVTNYTMVQASMRSGYVFVGGPYNTNRVASDLWYPVPSTSVIPTWDSNDDLKILDKLREKLQGSDFNAGVFLAEGHQTLSLIADSATRIAKALNHLRRGDIAGTARSLFEGTSRSPLKPYSSMSSPVKASPSHLSRHWLELQYGWLPLLLDAKGAAEYVAHKVSQPFEQQTRAARRKEGIAVSYIYDGWFPAIDPVLPYFAHKVEVYWRQRKTVTVIHRETGPSVWEELGLTDPASVLWEKLPYSFVADWFIPIGSFLGARGLASMYAGNTVINSSRIEKLWTQVVGLQDPDGGPLDTFSTTSWIGSMSDYNKRLISYSRVIGTGLNVPPPSFKPLAKAASWQHCANAVALLTQQFAGGRFR